MPAHVIVVTIGSAGDLFPFLRIATELARRGHRVSFFAPDLFAAYAQEAGLDFHGLPGDPAVLHDPDLGIRARASASSGRPPGQPCARSSTTCAPCPPASRP